MTNRLCLKQSGAHHDNLVGHLGVAAITDLCGAFWFLRGLLASAGPLWLLFAMQPNQGDVRFCMAVSEACYVVTSTCRFVHCQAHEPGYMCAHR